jgi:Vacuolar protein 14 C-terminal Fig4p binding
MKCFVNRTDVRSAELEMTVNMLIQIDKLVQLLESPVFTCRLVPISPPSFPNFSRPPTPASRARKVSSPIQMPLWPSHAASPIIRVCSIKEQIE